MMTYGWPRRGPVDLRPRSALATLALGLSVACGGADDDRPGPPPTPDCPTSATEGLSVDVSSVFAPGDCLRDAYTGALAEVAEDGTALFAPGDEGVVLIERSTDPDRQPAFTWDNATVYFVMTDRFDNGDPTNDAAYGRDFTGMPDTGTFHGGDWAGLTRRLDYIADLGVNALWITSPVEQIHGYVGGGGGNFPHFAYAGYWALDFTRTDANFGTEAELRALVDEAHARGIRIVLDVVMNHPGYASLPEIETYLPEALVQDDWRTWRPGPEENWFSYNELFIDFETSAWADWWGPDWVRAELPGGYQPYGRAPLQNGLAFLPDFRTESDRAVDLPPLLAAKPDSRVTVLPDATVRDHLVAWLTDWVREYGIDGFRCDTAKHVELSAWTELKAAGVAALAEWKASHPDQALDDLPFWMTAEDFGYSVMNDGRDDGGYFASGFDSKINFDFRGAAAGASRNFESLETIYRAYAETLNTDPGVGALTYISSHDHDRLFFDTVGRDPARQADAGTALLLAPGGVQIFYGDESGRTTADGNGDNTAGTRSDMNWNDIDQGLLEHWRTLGRFRERHPAVGGGTHTLVQNDGEAYVFTRTRGDDAVVVALVPPGE